MGICAQCGSLQSEGLSEARQTEQAQERQTKSLTHLKGEFEAFRLYATGRWHCGREFCPWATNGGGIASEDKAMKGSLFMNAAPLGRLCPNCYSGALRLSKLRSSDLGLLLTLRYPVRCKDCGERAYGFIWQVLAHRQARVA